MKKNRLICLALSLALLFALPACTEQDMYAGTTGTTAPTDPLTENNYEVFLSRKSADRSYFSEDAVSVNELYPEVTKPEPTEQTRTVQINGVSYELNYIRTYELRKPEYAHVYETTDEKVSCVYWAEDMQLTSVAINLDLADFADMDRQQYEQWIQTFVSQFMQKDWSKLQMSCQTQYKGAEDGFSTEPKDGEPVQGYRFSYVRYINSAKTTDDISVTFTINAEDGIMRVVAWFNRHGFDAVDTVEWDETTVEVVINEYLSEYAAENIVLKSWEVSDADELIMINGNIMLSRTISIAYTWKGINYDGSCELVIDIPDP